LTKIKKKCPSRNGKKRESDKIEKISKTSAKALYPNLRRGPCSESGSKNPPPPGGGFLFAMFPDQEAGGRGPPLKNQPPD